MLLRAFVMIIASTMLSGCYVMTAASTAGVFFSVHECRFIVEETPASATDGEHVAFDLLKQYWVSKDHTAFFAHEDAQSSSATFRIPPIGSDGKGWTLVADRIDLFYAKTVATVLRVSRATSGHEGFTEAELSRFASQVESSIEATSGHPIHLGLSNCSP
jgi:hypothetical protein